MTPLNLALNSASTKDWLEAMKNQSSSGTSLSHYNDKLSSSFTKEDKEDSEPAQRKEARRRAASEPGPKKK
jgi:hypothetical protein